MTNENRLVLELCRFRHPQKERLREMLSTPYDAAMVLGQLMYHRMGAIAFYVLTICGLTGKVNREFRNALRSAYDSGRRQTIEFRRMMSETADLLERVDFPYAVLKGARLAYEYPEGLRTSNDLDILIRQRDIDDLSMRLKEAGYIQGYIRDGRLFPATRSEILDSRLNRGETVPFVRQNDQDTMKHCEIDINFSLDFKAKQSSRSVELLLEDIRPMNVDGDRLLMTLYQEDFLLHLCAHLYKEAVVYPWVLMGRDLALYKFCDLYLLLDKEGDASLAGRLAHRIHTCGLEKECYYALSLTALLFDMDQPWLAALLQDIRPSDTTYMCEIIDPEKERKYQYSMNFVDWLFCPCRAACLQETGAGEAGKASRKG